MSDVTIHIDETLDSSTIQALQHDLSRMAGIEHIASEESHPHLMVVSYDNKMMNSGAILSSFTEQGLHAELIGF
jgi:hypothetical protein